VVAEHSVHLHTYGALIVFQVVDITSFHCWLFKFENSSHRKHQQETTKKAGLPFSKAARLSI